LILAAIFFAMSMEIAMRILVSAIILTMFSGFAFAVDGTNLPGRDYANFPAPSAFVCRSSCGGESRCQAYTFVKPGIQGPTGHCWLKSSLPAIERPVLRFRSAQVRLRARPTRGR